MNSEILLKILIEPRFMFGNIVNTVIAQTCW